MGQLGTPEEATCIFMAIHETRQVPIKLLMNRYLPSL